MARAKTGSAQVISDLKNQLEEKVKEQIEYKRKLSDSHDLVIKLKRSEDILVTRVKDDKEYIEYKNKELESTKKELADAKLRENAAKSEMICTNKQFSEISDKLAMLKIEREAERDVVKRLRCIIEDKDNELSDYIAKKESIKHLEKMNNILSRSFSSMQLKIVKREAIIVVMFLTTVILFYLLFKH